VSDKKHSANSALPSLWLPCGVCRGRHSANTRNPVVVSSDRLTFNGATSLRMKRSGRPTRIQRGNGDGSHHQLALLPRGSRTRLAGYSSCVARLASLAPPDAGPRPNRRIRVLTFYREQELLAAHLVFLARERLWAAAYLDNEPCTVAIGLGGREQTAGIHQRSLEQG